MTDAEKGDAKKNWAELSDNDAEDDDHNQEEAAEVVPKKVIPPTMKGKKNKNGDYVVTDLFIEDNRVGVKKDGTKVEEVESSSDEGYGDEDDEPAAKAVEVKEEKKEAPKQKTKKELKAEEDAEFEALMGGVAAPAKAEESKK